VSLVRLCTAAWTTRSSGYVSLYAHGFLMDRINSKFSWSKSQPSRGSQENHPASPTSSATRVRQRRHFVSSPIPDVRSPVGDKARQAGGGKSRIQVSSTPRWATHRGSSRCAPLSSAGNKLLSIAPSWCLLVLVRVRKLLPDLNKKAEKKRGGLNRRMAFGMCVAWGEEKRRDVNL
jgi:hypothetical protein